MLSRGSVRNSSVIHSKISRNQHQKLSWSTVVCNPTTDSGDVKLGETQQIRNKIFENQVIFYKFIQLCRAYLWCSNESYRKHFLKSLLEQLELTVWWFFWCKEKSLQSWCWEIATLVSLKLKKSSKPVDMHWNQRNSVSQGIVLPF